MVFLHFLLAKKQNGAEEVKWFYGTVCLLYFHNTELLTLKLQVAMQDTTAEGYARLITDSSFLTHSKKVSNSWALLKEASEGLSLEL